jgi:hypothetical protein
MPDRTGLYQQLKSIGRHSIVEPASEWYGI